MINNENLIHIYWFTGTYIFPALLYVFLQYVVTYKLVIDLASVFIACYNIQKKHFAFQITFVHIVADLFYSCATHTLPDLAHNFVYQWAHYYYIDELLFQANHAKRWSEQHRYQYHHLKWTDANNLIHSSHYNSFEVYWVVYKAQLH